MNQVRGILLLAAGGLVLFQGWRLHGRSDHYTLLAVGVGLLAIALGLWRITRK